MSTIHLAKNNLKFFERKQKLHCSANGKAFTAYFNFTTHRPISVLVVRSHLFETEQTHQVSMKNWWKIYFRLKIIKLGMLRALMLCGITSITSGECDTLLAEKSFVEQPNPLQTGGARCKGINQSGGWLRFIDQSLSEWSSLFQIKIRRQVKNSVKSAAFVIQQKACVNATIYVVYSTITHN